MKLRCEVLSVDSKFPDLTLRVQGKQRNGAEWRPMSAFTISIPAHDKTAKAFYVGRIITIEVKPQ